MFKQGDKVIHKPTDTVMVVVKVIGNLLVGFEVIETILLVEWFDGTSFKQKQLPASSFKLVPIFGAFENFWGL